MWKYVSIVYLEERYIAVTTVAVDVADDFRLSVSQS